MTIVVVFYNFQEWTFEHKNAPPSEIFYVLRFFYKLIVSWNEFLISLSIVFLIQEAIKYYERQRYEEKLSSYAQQESYKSITELEKRRKAKVSKLLISLHKSSFFI